MAFLWGVGGCSSDQHLKEPRTSREREKKWSTCRNQSTHMFCTDTHCTDSTSKYTGPLHGNMSCTQVTCIDNADGKYEQILICSTRDIVLLCYTTNWGIKVQSKLLILKNYSVRVLLAYWKAVLSVHSLHSWVHIHSDCKLGCGFTEHQVFSPSVQVKN